jgi:hypothetical protein
MNTLKGAPDRTIAKPTIAGDETKDKDPDHLLVEGYYPLL